MPKPRTWGFRLSVSDVVMLLVGVGMAWFFRNEVLVWPIPLIATGHFFLLCNVFRITTRWEMGWVVVLLVNAGLNIHLLGRGWGTVLLLQSPFTAYALWHATRQPYYHGIFARRWNAKLDEYLTR